MYSIHHYLIYYQATYFIIISSAYCPRGIALPCLLSRRYSDRHSDSSTPIIGLSGSTLLHFAAVNGHTNVVRTILLHSAHADQADKHRVKPEMLARENGKEGMAEAKEWLAKKYRDLRDRSGVRAGV